MGAIRSSRFWKRVLLIAVPIILVLAILFYLQGIVDYSRSLTLRYVLQNMVVNTHVFLDTVEIQKTDDNAEYILWLMKVRLNRMDQEYGINSLLVDEQGCVASERAITDPFCDPFTMPEDTTPLFDAIFSEDESGYFDLVCGGNACFWYYQHFDVGGERYTVLAGIQPITFEHVTVKADTLYSQAFLFGGVLIALLWVITYLTSKSIGMDKARRAKDKKDKKSLKGDDGRENR